MIAFGLAAGLALGLPLLLESWGVPTWPARALALGVGAATGWWCSLPVLRSLRALRGSAERFSRGDLTGPIEIEAGRRLPDETVDLARSLRGMRDGLCELVEHVQRAAAGVAESSREVMRSSEGVRGTHRELVASMREVADRAVRQQEDVQAAAAQSREISGAIGRNAAAAREAFGFASDADQCASAGVEASQLTLEKLRRLFERVDQAGDLVQKLEDKIRSVHRVTELITSGADKTHTLSLNASIEAARAGEAGRGFAVVAEEIRKLAESASGRAEQIEGLIGQLEDESGRIAQVMHAAGDEVCGGREDLDRIRSALERTQASVQEGSQRSESIFHEADAQVGAARHMVDGVEGVAAAAAQNARSTEAMRQALGVQSEQMDGTVSQASRLSEMATQLGELARRFRTQ